MFPIGMSGSYLLFSIIVLYLFCYFIIHIFIYYKEYMNFRINRVCSIFTSLKLDDLVRTFFFINTI